MSYFAPGYSNAGTGPITCYSEFPQKPDECHTDENLKKELESLKKHPFYGNIKDFNPDNLGQETFFK